MSTNKLTPAESIGLICDLVEHHVRRDSRTNVSVTSGRVDVDSLVIDFDQPRKLTDDSADLLMRAFGAEGVVNGRGFVRLFRVDKSFL